MAKYYVDREYAECMKSEICTKFPENHNAYFRQHQFGFDLDTRYKIYHVDEIFWNNIKLIFVRSVIFENLNWM